jgi:malate dehydrogenase (oxaloacetate-decarboxylating)
LAVSTSIIIRLDIDKTKVSFGEVAIAIGHAGGDVVAIDVIHSGKHRTTRDITVNLTDLEGSQRIKTELNHISGVRVVNISDSTFLVHLGGKIEIQPKMPIKNRDDLSRVYTPGVAQVCKAIYENKSKAYALTIKRNTVAVVSDGTAVLGLGDIGPEAAMPVMEGKAMLFKQLADVDAFPLCLETKDVDEIVRTIKVIAPSFGGINLEDISSPRCFEIEERLRDELNIPVFHDDQHGTAVVVLAGLFNALKLVHKEIESIRVVVIGIGAAGVACCKMLIAAGVQDLIAVDREGAIVNGGEPYANAMWNWLAEHSNPNRRMGMLSEVIEGADVFVGVSGPGVLKVEDIQKMARDPIVFAMANPEPEIDPELAEPYVRVLATGRSDYPNQVNNVLVFPGIFRGALDCQAKTINEEMKLATARAIASVVTEEELNEQYIIPSIFNEKVVNNVRNAVIRAAIDTDVARRIPKDFR